MNLRRWVQVVFSIFAIVAAIPGAHRAAAHLDAYELIWLIPFLPAFTVTFFWIVIVMVGNFIKADSYKNPSAIDQARRFLAVFDWVFLAITGFFILGGVFLYVIL